MKKSCKACWIVNVVLVLALVYGGYIFGIRGNVEKAADGRSAVLMSSADRIRVLGDMRSFLETVQSITDSAVSGDMKSVEQVARAHGSAKSGKETAAFMGSLPLGFKTLGLGTHTAFDALADLAATNPAPKVLLGQLGNLMLNCVACHESYTLKATD